MIGIILAGGNGKRMCSDIPKVLHHVTDPNNKLVTYPMIILVILRAIEINCEKIFIVVGKYKDIIQSTINYYIDTNIITKSDLIEYVIQHESLGTGHAIKCTLPYIKNYEGGVVILSGDVPLISINLLNNLTRQSNTILIAKLDNPTGCGRIILNNYNVINIIEEKDCTSLEKNNKLVNCGIYYFEVNNLINLIPLINNNNAANEYYLTDIIKLMVQNNIEISYYMLDDDMLYQIKNVNTRSDLDELNEFIYNMVI